MRKQKFMTVTEITDQIEALQTRMEEQQDRLAAFLVQLGDTEAKIAAKLRRRKIKAVPGDPRKCALAEALVQEFGIADVKVSGARNIRVDGYSIDHLDNAPAIDRFINLFDDGGYPALVKGKKKGKKKSKK